MINYTTITPYQAIKILNLCLSPHRKRYMIPGLIRSTSEQEILRAISQKNAFSSQKSITSIVGLSRPEVAKILHDMEENGLITREIGDNNKREKSIFLTKKGEGVLFWQYNRQIRYEEIMYSGISDDDLALHVKVTHKMTENLMDASERQLYNMPPFDELSTEKIGDIPVTISRENQIYFLNMVKRIDNINSIGDI